MKFFSILGWLIILGGPLASAPKPFSLMLSSAEQTALQKALSHQPGSKIKSLENALNFPDYSPDSQTFFLSAILYFSPEKWTIWINDQMITNLGQMEGVHLKCVLPDHIILQTFKDKTIDFSLKPNQSFIVQEERVVEGDRRLLIPLPSGAVKASE